MKAIYNTTTRQADLIPDNATPPTGWTDKHPRWQLNESWDGSNWSVPENVEELILKDKEIANLKSQLSQNDMEMARVWESVVDLLDSENILKKSKLTKIEKDKLIARKAVRLKLQNVLKDK